MAINKKQAELPNKQEKLGAATKIKQQMQSGATAKVSAAEQIRQRVRELQQAKSTSTAAEQIRSALVRTDAQSVGKALSKQVNTQTIDKQVGSTEQKQRSGGMKNAFISAKENEFTPYAVEEEPQQTAAEIAEAHSETVKKVEAAEKAHTQAVREQEYKNRTGYAAALGQNKAAQAPASTYAASAGLTKTENGIVGQRRAELNALKDTMGEQAASYYYRENQEKTAQLKQDGQATETYQALRDIQADAKTIAGLDISPAYAPAIEAQNRKTYKELSEKYGVDNLSTLYKILRKTSANLKKELEEKGYDFDRLSGYEDRLSNAQKAREEQNKTEKFAYDHPILASGASVVASPLQGLEYAGVLGSAIGKSDTKNLDTYAPLDTSKMTATSFVQTARGTVAQKIENSLEGNWGKVGSFAYQTGMSMADFLYTAALTGNFTGGIGGTGSQAAMKAAENFSLAIMGGSAAANTTMEAVERGLTNRQALTLGAIAGMAEIVTEKVSLESLLDMTSLSASKVGYVLQNVLAEGSEEVASDLINLAADVLVSKNKSQWQMSINAYQANGMTAKEAFWNAVRDQAVEMGVDFLGGAVSGGVMAGGSVAVNSALNEQNNRRNGSEIQGLGNDIVEATIQEGLDSERGTKSYKLAKRLREKLNRGQALTASEVGQLYQANVETIEAEEARKRAGQEEGVIVGGILPGTPAPHVDFMMKSNGIEIGADGWLRKGTRKAFASIHGNEIGLVYDDYVANYVTPAEAEGINTVAKMLGARVCFAETVDGRIANAKIKGNEILIEKNNPNPTMFLLGHEVTHRVQDLAPTEYAEFQKEVAPELHDKAAELMKTYVEYGIDIDYERAMDEATADYAGQLMENGEVLEQFIERHRTDRTLLERFRDAIRTIIKKITGKEKAQLQTAEGKLTAALEAASKQAQKNTATESGAGNYSIQELADGKRVAVVDDDILSGLDVSTWNTEKKAQAKAAAKKALLAYSDGIVANQTNYRVNRTSRREYTRSNATEKLYRRSSEGFADKMRASAYVGDVITATGNWKSNGGLAHPRTDNFVDFLHGDVLLQAGDNQYKAETVIGVTSDGEYVFYDVVNMEPTKFSVKKETSTTASGNNTISDIQEVSLENSISASEENVNSKYSSRERGDERYSIQELADGKRYVQADRQVIFGNDPGSWSEQLEAYINGKIRQGGNITLIGADGDELILTATSAGKLSDNHTSDGRTMSDQAFERKVNAATHIDELAQVSRRGERMVQDYAGRHGKMAERGWNYRTAYFEDFDGKYYEVTISVAQNADGSMIYNIGKIKEEAHPKISGSRTVSDDGLRGFASSEASISASEENVNSKYSLKTGQEQQATAESKAITARKNFKNNLRARFSTEAGRRGEIGQLLDSVADQIVRDGTLTEAARQELFEQLYEAGEVTVPADEYDQAGRDAVRGKRIYVDEQTKHEFSDDWSDFRKRAFSAGVYLVNDTQAEGIDSLYQELNAQMPGLFQANEYDNRAILENIVQVAENGKGTKMSLAEHTAMVAEQEGVSEEVLRADMERGFDYELRLFTDAAKQEIELRSQRGQEQVERYQKRIKDTREWAHAQVDQARAEKREAIRKKSEWAEAKVAQTIAEQRERDKRTKEWAFAQTDKARAERNAGIQAANERADRRIEQIEAPRREKIEDINSGVPQTERQAVNAYAKLKQARWELERVKEGNKLTEIEKNLLNGLLRGEFTFDELDQSQRNNLKLLCVYEAAERYDVLTKQLAKYRKAQRAKLLELADEYLGTADAWKDKNVGILYSRETMERNIEDIVPDRGLAKEIIAEYITPVHTQEANATRAKNQYRDRVRELNLSRKVAEGNTVSEAYAVQLLGEAQDNVRMLEKNKPSEKYTAKRDGYTLVQWRRIIDDLFRKNPKMDWGKVQNAIEEFHSIYDDLFQQINEVRVRNGYEPINYHQGYFPHFLECGGDDVLAKMGRALGIETNVQTLPTTINGLTHTFRPGVAWFSHGLERKGRSTFYDAVEGFDQYIEGATSVIYQTDNIQKLRALASEIRYRTSGKEVRNQIEAVRNLWELTEQDKNNRIREIYENGESSLSNFVVELEEYTNLLAGKKSRADRDMEQALGRRMYSLVKSWESRVGANMIAGNLSSAFTNFIPLTQAGAQTGELNIIRGMWDTLKSYKTDDGFAAASSFLTNRRGSDPVVQTWAQKASAVLGKPMEFIDTFTADSVVRARYYQNLQKGLSEDAALNEADSFAGRVMADRSKGSMPTLFNRSNPVTKAFTQFQLEVNNQFSEIFKDLPRGYRDKGLKALAAVLIKYFVGAFLFNEVYELFVGRRAALDPIGILNDSVGDLTGYQLPNLFEMGADLVTGKGVNLKTEKVGIGEAGKNLTQNVLGELPFSSGLAMLGVDVDGGCIPAASAVPDLTAIWDAATTEGWSGEKRWKEVQDELNKLAYIIPPFGGNQVQKIWKSVKALSDGGSYTVDAEGNQRLQYPVYTDNAGETAVNAGKMLLFGKNSLSTAQDWVDNGCNTLSVKQTAAYRDMLEAGVSGRDAYELLGELGAVGKEDMTEAEKSKKKREILRSSEVSDEGKAIAYYTLLASKKERELMDRSEIENIGATYKTLLAIKDASTLTGTAASNAKRTAIMEEDLTDEEKKTIYRYMLGSKQDDGSYTSGRDDDISAFERAGLSFDDFLTVQNEYAEINTEYTGAADKALAFSRWVNEEFSAKEGETIKKCFAYYSQVPSEAKKYDSFVSAGLDSDTAYTLTVALNDLQPENGKNSVSSLQQYRAVIDTVKGYQNRIIALEQIMSDSERVKFRAAIDSAMLPEWYVMAKEAIAKIDDNGSVTQEEAKRAIDTLDLTTMDKAVLWQVQNKSWKWTSNPFSTKTGKSVYEFLQNEADQANTSTQTAKGMSTAEKIMAAMPKSQTQTTEGMSTAEKIMAMMPKSQTQTTEGMSTAEKIIAAMPKSQTQTTEGMSTAEKIMAMMPKSQTQTTEGMSTAEKIIAAMRKNE